MIKTAKKCFKGLLKVYLEGQKLVQITLECGWLDYKGTRSRRGEGPDAARASPSCGLGQSHWLQRAPERLQGLS